MPRGGARCSCRKAEVAADFAGVALWCEGEVVGVQLEEVSAAALFEQSAELRVVAKVGVGKGRQLAEAEPVDVAAAQPQPRAELPRFRRALHGEEQECPHDDPPRCDRGDEVPDSPAVDAVGDQEVIAVSLDISGCRSESRSHASSMPAIALTFSRARVCLSAWPWTKTGNSPDASDGSSSSSARHEIGCGPLPPQYVNARYAGLEWPSSAT